MGMWDAAEQICWKPHAELREIDTRQREKFVSVRLGSERFIFPLALCRFGKAEGLAGFTSRTSVTCQIHQNIQKNKPRATFLTPNPITIPQRHTPLPHWCTLARAHTHMHATSQGRAGCAACPRCLCVCVCEREVERGMFSL